MHILFVVLALVAAGMVFALAIGATLKLIGLLILALLVVGAASWLMWTIKGRAAEGIAVLDAHRAERARR